MFTLLDKFVCLFIVINFYGFVNADTKDQRSEKTGYDDRGMLWFGPRLGKRSLRIYNEGNKQAFYKLLEAADALKYYYDQLPYVDAQVDEPETKVTKKVIFTPKLGRNLDQYKRAHDNVEFTPRLGRRLSDDLPVTPPDQEVYPVDPEQIDSRIKYFSPRLGRTMNFSPRLGRQISYEMYPENVRVVRSVNKTAT